MKFFKLSKLRRFIILGVTIVSAVLAIALGSSLGIAKNVKKGIEYGGGAEFIAQVNPDDSSVHAEDIAASVAESISDRIDPLGVSGATVDPEKTGVDFGAQIRVTYPGLTNKDDIQKMKDLIVNKPTLTLTDIYGNPMFDSRGHFNNRLDATTTRGFVGVDSKIGTLDSTDIENFKDVDTTVPIADNGALGQQTSTGEHEVQLTLINGTEFTTAWTQATDYISKLPDGTNQMYTWLNYQGFIEMAKTNYPNEWNKAGHNPYVFAHVDEKLMDENKKPNVLKKNVFDTEQWMISAASVSQSLSGRSFVISGNFTQAEVEDLARKINFGVAHYSLSSSDEPRDLGAAYGSNAFNKAMIAGMVVFAFVAIFLTMNYGLLGALSTISIALYIFLILAMFTVMRGEYSPETIAALIIGIGMGVDANIITFERLKSEVYRGSSIKKSFNKSNKQSLTTILDANITTLIVAFVLFYFGTKSIVGLSVTLILSIAFTLIVMLGFTRFMATMLVNTGVFENRKHLLGIRPKFDQKIQKKIDKVDYVKSSKWFVTGSAVIFGISLIVMAITAIIAGTISGGFNVSQEFTGGTIMDITNKGDAQHGIDIVNGLKNLGIPVSDITTTNASGIISTVNVHSTFIVDLGSQQMEDFRSLTVLDTAQISNTTADVANKLVENSMIAISIAIALIIFYTMIRFKWTFSIAAIVALVHDGLMVTALFIICRVEISPVFIAGLLSILGYSINDTIVTFDRIREKLNNSTGELVPEKIKSIANEAIRDTFKRSILTSLTTIVAVLILMSFGNATKLSFNFAMLVGLVAGTYSSIFIASYLWVKLEIRRQKRIKIRAKNGFWHTDEINEQTFEGINDFIA